MILATTRGVAKALSAVPPSTWVRIGAYVGIGTVVGRGGLSAATRGLHWATGALVNLVGSGRDEVEADEAEAPRQYRAPQPRG